MMIPHRPKSKRKKRVFPTLVLFFVLVAISFTFLRFFATSVFATTYSVSKIADTNDGTCDADCSLREAITAANANAGADTINFSISGSGVHTIVPTSALPSITSPVTINGYSQTGATANTAAAPNPLNGTLTIEIDGTSAGSVSGLTFASGSDGSTVKGLVVNRFAGPNGIGIGTDNITVQGNYVGTDTTGLIDRGNSQSGIAQAANDSDSAQIGGLNPEDRNLISGNDACGSSPNTNSDNWVYQGNYIGVNKSGTGAIANGNASGCGGMSIDNCSGTTVGGTATGAANVISGNASGGIQPDNSPNTTIQGNFIGTDYTGTVAIPNAHSGVAMYLGSPNSVIGGTTAAARNIISGNTESGVSLNAVDLNVVQGNYIGTDVNGTAALPNVLSGVSLGQGTTNSTIGGTTAGARNIISGNTERGINFYQAGIGNIVQGNYIGTDVIGTADLGNVLAGISIDGTPSTTIGGTASGARNIISGNNEDGVYISNSGATSNSIQGNYIGTDVNGTADLGNTGNGIYVSTANNTIGGTTSGARNVISGNGAIGMSIQPGSDGTIIQGNYIGLNAAGTAGIGNTSHGIAISSNSVTVGGTISGAGNVISGSSAINADGIFLQGGFGTARSGHIIQGNYIGTDASGNVGSGLGNYVGILALGDTVNNLIGGTASGAGNIIAGNATAGILIATYFGFMPVDNSILGNSIYSNGSTSTQLGINLLDGQLGTDSGVHVLDTGDTDTGANDYMNFPVFTNVSSPGPSEVRVTYNLDINDSESGATGYRVEFFASSAGDVSGNGEGQRYIGADTVSGDVTGRTAILFIPTDISGTQYITSTVTMTDASSDGYGSTSEFSAYLPPVSVTVNGPPSTSTVASKPTCDLQSGLSAPDLFQVDIKGIEATLHISPPTGGSYDKYFVSYSESEKAEAYGVEYSQSRTSGATTYNVGFLNPLTQYYFKVRAGNGCHPGPWSTNVKAKTASKSNTSILKFFPQWRVDMWNAATSTGSAGRL